MSPQAKPVQILIVDDNTIIREAFAQLIAQESHLKVCGQGWDIPSALKAFEAVKADMALIDISLDSKESGLELIRLLRKKYPQLLLLAVSLHDAEVYEERVMQAGGNGYLMKQEAGDCLILALDQIRNGRNYFSSSISPTSAAEIHPA